MSKKLQTIVATLLTLPLVGGTVGSIVYTQVASSEKKNNGSDISDLNISFSKTVIHMDSIKNNEAQTIVTDLTALIVTKMNEFSAQLNVDYTIEGLSGVQSGTDLSELGVTVKSNDNNSKIKGQATVTFAWKEDIDSWENPAIPVPQSEVNGLTTLTATNLQNNVELTIIQFMALGQVNVMDFDYTIVGLDLIVEGATYASYETALTVQSGPNTSQLIGQFTIVFMVI